eukprot:CAMPEP_0184867732 /NCGR_PEP_ID=MMETSP0580-20130426/27568_1 /TAXON_ID=1118495 /ORGANISM="Dactyliosolen fragilissimus" /LENGTH=277 /DNA_ID=CAMNT_0027368167 /DNA_START=57 /DNA_END=890 /DNA_ORIENTATION=-
MKPFLLNKHFEISIVISLTTIALFKPFAHGFELNPKKSHNHLSRRTFHRWGISTWTTVVATSILNVPQGLAAPIPVENIPLPSSLTIASTATDDDDIEFIKQASSTLGILLDNWDKATTDCNYADVPKELLESKNKEQLLEKASTFALFDKSTSVVSCRKNNKIVRDYIDAVAKGKAKNGSNGVAIDKRILNRKTIDSLDPDYLDEYIAEAESFSEAMSRALSLSYTAGMSDFDSVNNFSKDDNNAVNENSNLEQSRKAITEAKQSIDKLLLLLVKE